ncbi:cytochrome p450 [Lasallia pustulata]|uniref:Cytochrome p450 n=1 Tax=Lasallia pustulata TaxID=136370 RepID=A0A1W5CT52_9LECA|nr:cytochrome p450 [Lasallia pustulata]
MLKEFFIGSPSTGRCVQINVSAAETLQELRSGIANAFSILPKDSISFENTQRQLSTLESVIKSNEPVQVRVDEHHVREPLGPKALPLVGNHYELYPDHVGNHERLFARYGPVIKTVNMGTTIYLTNDPNVSRYVLSETEYFTKTTTDPQHPLHYMRDNTALFTCDSDAPVFKVAHKFVPPSMSPKAVRHYSPIMQEAVERSFKAFDELDRQDLAFNCYQYMFKLAGQIIYKMVLGMSLDHFENINSPPHEIIRLLGEYLILMKKVSLRPQWYSYLPFGPPKRLAWVKDRIWKLVDQAIEQRPRAPDGDQDLPLHDAALKATCVADYLCRAIDEKGQKLSHEYMLSNCVVLVGAGFITSASLLSWLIYALVKYPGNQERLLQELVDHGATADTKWRYDTIQSMKFLDKFVKEVQRVHNPSFQTARNAKKDVVLPGGYLLPKGAVIIPTFPSLHMNEAYWDNPNKFDPDRWDSDAVKQRHKMVYTPFATGPRGCIGFNVALQEAKLTLANLVYRYHWEDASTEPMVYDPEFLVMRPLNFYARAVQRTTWPQKSHE